MSAAGRVDAETFLRSVTAVRPVPFVPEVLLHQGEDAMDLWERTETRTGVGQPPPFWAFAWAGGQALARYVLDRPHVVRGRRVLDFASGAGLVAVAAALAGAERVVAAEIDPFAVAAAGVNAAANGVVVAGLLADLTQTGAAPVEALLGGRVEVVLAGDVFYDRDMAAVVHPLLAGFAAAGALVVVGDPGRAYLPHEAFSEVARYEVPVLRTLEDRDTRSTAVLELRGRSAR